MRTSRKRWWSLLATLMLVVGSVTASVTVAPPPASAGCAGVLNGFWYMSYYTVWNPTYLRYEDVPAVYEEPRGSNSSTCDQDNVYLGSMWDLWTDGACAHAVYYDPFRSVNAVGCSLNTQYNYTFFDQQGDSWATYGAWPGPDVPGYWRYATAGF